MPADCGDSSPLIFALLCLRPLPHAVIFLHCLSPSVHRFVVTLLDSKSTEMCYSACGVLTNLALDPPNRVSLSLEGAAAK